jgi:hypothetical protein
LKADKEAKSFQNLLHPMPTPNVEQVHQMEKLLDESDKAIPQSAPK